jgi:hypothetical protein
MTGDARIYSNIERLGDRYISRYLTVWDKKRLEQDWWEALKFFFYHSFMRARRDQLSDEYYCFTVEMLKDYLAINDDNHAEVYEAIQTRELNGQPNPRWVLDFKKDHKLSRKNSLKHQQFQRDVATKNQLIERLTTPKNVFVHTPDNSYCKNISLGNDSDVIMVLDELRFVAAKKSHQNVITYLVSTIQNNGIQQAHSELTKIQQIGDKLASFIIKDILLLNPELTTADLDYSGAFPVDTWVKKIAKSLECQHSNLEKIKSCFIFNCKRFDVNPCKFAAGLWFLGIYSLDILLAFLERETLEGT